MDDEGGQAMPREKYDRVSVALHWLMAVVVTGQTVFGLVLDDLAARGSPERLALLNLHKSIGIALGLVVFARLAWRLGHRPPAWPDSMNAVQQKVALWGHRALYALLILVPLVPFVAAQFDKGDVSFFGLSVAPLGPDMPALAKALNVMHKALAWGLAALVVGHALTALMHAWVDEDGIFDRMRF